MGPAIGTGRFDGTKVQLAEPRVAGTFDGSGRPLERGHAFRSRHSPEPCVVSRTRPILLSFFLLAASATPINAAPASSPPVAAAHHPEAKAPDVEHGRPARVTDRLIVQWKQPQNAAANEHARGMANVKSVHGANGPSVVRTNRSSVEQAVKQLSADPAVAWVEPDYLMQVDAVAVNDLLSSEQYSLDRMRVRDAWSLTKGGSRLIAVLDTGVQFNHPDLVGRISSGGYDFVNNDSSPSEDNGHGTWVSGIIAANPNNGRGSAGISWTDKILPVKVMDAQGYGYSSDIALGIDYAVSKGAKVINMSIGGFEYSLAVKAAVDRAWAAGSVLVAAAGNYRTDQPSYPASYDHVVSVSATQADDEFTNWSNYGKAVDVAAPGAAVTTTNCNACNGWGDYTAISGTSFASPNTAGVIALIMAKYPAYTNAQVVGRLLSTTDDLGFPGWDDRYGHGRVNAYRAVGGSPARLAAQTGDSLERNDSSTTGRALSFGTAKPSIYPAGDIDYFALSAPRPGRIDLAVTPVIDTSRPIKSALSVDPVLELWVNGALLKTIDDPNSSATVERVSYQAAGPKKITLGVHNWLPNGSKTPYTLTSAFVDNVAPAVVGRTPGPGATNVSRFPNVVTRFDEPVQNVSGSSLRLRDSTSRALVPGSASYDSSRREGHLTVSTKLAPEHRYTVEIASAITDSAGNAIAPVSWTFTTGISGYIDSVGSPYEYDIAWLADSGITAGCGVDRFCPRDPVTREQMASFLSRALELPLTSMDFFDDDASSDHQADINRLAASGITRGCAVALFCPRATVSREQMASFLARALELPSTTRDYFTDDENSPHQVDINRLAAADITGGCSAVGFCPRTVVTREQMAAFLHRAFTH